MAELEGKETDRLVCNCLLSQPSSLSSKRDGRCSTSHLHDDRSEFVNFPVPSASWTVIHTHTHSHTHACRGTCTHTHASVRTGLLLKNKLVEINDNAFLWFHLIFRNLIFKLAVSLP